MKEKILRGIPISSGAGIGKIFLYHQELPIPKEREISEDEAEREIARFHTTLTMVGKELEGIYQRVREEMGADIADFIMFQILLLKDAELIGRVERFIREQKRDAAFSYYQVIKDYAAPLANSPLPFMRERSIDIADLSNRVLSSLIGKDLSSPLPKERSLLSLKEEVLLFAHSLAPSEVAILDKRRVLGIALEVGGKSGHIAIMAKAKEIPAVCGVVDLLSNLRKPSKEGRSEQGIVDGDRGIVILNPTEKRISQYKRRVEEDSRKRASYFQKTEEEPVTKDGKYIDISANVEFIGEVEKAKKYGAKGIGLLRTEYLFLSRRRPPTEEEQFFFYREVSSQMRGHPVIIRTFDLGGDKILPGYSETNPFLGWRGIRVGLAEKEFLLTQLRAILKASAENRNLKIMFPMISSLEEMLACRRVLGEVKEDLKRKGVPFDSGIEFGIMVETPSCALMAESFAKMCHFFSIGSNDLTQYTIACARDNERVAYLYDPFHPSVVRLYKETIDAARRAGIWVGLCGELASEPLGIILLVGLGIDELSMVPHRVPQAKEIIRSIELFKLQESMAKVLTFSTGKAIKRFLIKEVRRLFPKLAEGLGF